MFVKLPSAVIATGEAIRLPPGRTQIDWECELGVVIGREARQVDVAKAADFIFGYTLENDVSDRGGRGDTAARRRLADREVARHLRAARAVRGARRSSWPTRRSSP